MLEFIREYAVSIMTVSVLTVLLENILPNDSNKKYIHVVIGLLMMLVILNPLTGLPHYNDTFSIPHLHIGDDQLNLNTGTSHVTNSFQKNLAYAIMEDCHEQLGITIACRVYAEENAEREITGIKQIIISPYDQKTARYIAATYGVKEEYITQ